MKLLLLGVLCVAWLPYSNSFSSGAPPSACQSMVPVHSVLPQSSSSPFEIDVSSSSYNPSDVLTVTIQQKSGLSNQFSAFLIQARRADWQLNQYEPIGTFSVVGGTQAVCTGTYGNGLTHTSTGSSVLKNSLTLTWTAPSTAQGHVVFKATVATSKTVFWTNVASSIVEDPTAPTIPPTTPAPELVESEKSVNPYENMMEKYYEGWPINVEEWDKQAEQILVRKPRAVDTQSALAAVDLSGCGSTKGCYRYPDGCGSQSCEMIVTWWEGSDYVDFELQGSTSGWIAVGFSQDTSMGADSVIECVFDGKTVQVRQSYNLADTKSNAVLNNPLVGLSGQSGYATSSGGSTSIRCNFRRAKTVPGNKEVADFTKRHYIMLVQGRLVEGTTDTKKMHETDANKGPRISPRMVSTSENVNLSGEAKYPMVKAHGCLMVIAWVMSAGLAIILARYYKPMYPNKSLCGEKVWFALHRGLMLTTLLCVVVGFIIIFIHAGGYSQLPNLPDKAHPILGIIITILTILNPLVALCRCHPKHKYRPVYNWIHWFIGTIAFVLQSPNVFIGLGMRKTGVPSWLTWVMVAFLLFHIVIELMLEIHGCINSKKDKERREEWEMRKKNELGEIPAEYPEPVGTRFKTILLVLYIIVMLVLGLTLVITIAVS